MLNMKRIFRTINKAIAFSGYEIVRRSNSNQMQGGLERLKLLGMDPKVIVDVGAASGKWTELALNFWPQATYKLIEPLSEQTLALDTLKAKHQNVSYHLAVAGQSVGEVSFSITKDLDGSGVYGDNAENVRKIQVLRIDDIVAGNEAPVLIKLDTHGYEIPILDGARKTLERTSALVIEVYGFYVSPTGVLFHSLSDYLEKSGFRLYDIVDIMRRQKDKAFWQADAIFLRKDHPIFQDNTYW